MAQERCTPPTLSRRWLASAPQRVLAQRWPTRAAWISKLPLPWRAIPTMPSSSWAPAPRRAAIVGASHWTMDAPARASTLQAPPAAASTNSRMPWSQRWPRPTPGPSSWRVFPGLSSCRGSIRYPPSSPTSCPGSRQETPSPTCSSARSTRQPSCPSRCPTGRTRSASTRASTQEPSAPTTCTTPPTRSGCWWATATTTPTASASPRASRSATASPTPPSPTPACPSAGGAWSSPSGTPAPWPAVRLLSSTWASPPASASPSASSRASARRRSWRLVTRSASRLSLPRATPLSGTQQRTAGRPWMARSRCTWAALRATSVCKGSCSSEGDSARATLP
mmetsp:Transcript_20317/g.57163  ORF Transcript_20317/g.57163 Transcript_20317/m.57163 type:complete len:337 (-) Transcript_20317:35-1045(-)